MHTFRASLSASSRLACARASCFLMSCCCNRTLSLSIWCWSCLTSFLAMSHFNDSFSSLCKTKIKKKQPINFKTLFVTHIDALCDLIIWQYKKLKKKLFHLFIRLTQIIKLFRLQLMRHLLIGTDHLDKYLQINGEFALRTLSVWALTDLNGNIFLLISV